MTDQQRVYPCGGVIRAPPLGFVCLAVVRDLVFSARMLSDSRPWLQVQPFPEQPCRSRSCRGQGYAERSAVFFPGERRRVAFAEGVNTDVSFDYTFPLLCFIQMLLCVTRPIYLLLFYPSDLDNMFYLFCVDGKSIKC